MTVFFQNARSVLRVPRNRAGPGRRRPERRARTQALANQLHVARVRALRVSRWILRAAWCRGDEGQGDSSKYRQRESLAGAHGKPPPK